MSARPMRRAGEIGRRVKHFEAYRFWLQMAERFKGKLRARGRLTEAQSLLNELKRNRNNLNNFQRHLNAFISAWRSITWVLQKDIKRTLAGAPRENRAELMRWYGEEAQSLRALPHAEALLELRNVLEKEGSRLPVYQFVLIGLSDEFQTLELSYDVSTSQFIKVGGQIDPEAALRHGAVIRLPKPMTGEEAESWTAENQKTVGKEALNILAHQFERLTAGIKLVSEQKKKAAGYIQLVIDDAGTTMPVDEFITLLESRTKSLEQLVAEAEKRIPDP